MASTRKNTGANGGAGRDLHALFQELKRVEAALKKAQALARKLEKQIAAGPRVTRFSRDLAKKRVTRYSRDL